ncbi:MAG: hypothetical protein IT162_14680 [Bryobacterales bacterium]|nr:hypothetical protein [Bryobacterales bacterium]
MPVVAAPKPAVPAKSAAASKPAKAERPKKWTANAELTDFFPHEMLREETIGVCLACILDVFTRYLGMAAVTAQKQMRAHQPTLDELHASPLGRPYFRDAAPGGACPHCHSPAKWLAELKLVRIEGGKATDAARRELQKSLPTSKGQYEFLDQKSTGREAFFQWLEHAGREFDFDHYSALIAATRLYLERRFTDVDWDAEFSGVRVIRRSRDVPEGWLKEPNRLVLSAMLFDEVLAIQYLLSRSQRSGGVTFEGRMTLQELVSRLRGSGYLRHLGVQASMPGDILEQLLDHLSGGDAALKFHYILDRRDFLDKLAALKSARVPKLKLGAGAAE